MLLVRHKEHASLTGIEAQEGFTPSVQASLEAQTLAPVTYVPKQSKSWLGSLGETLRGGFRSFATPVAACLIATTLLGGCVTTGARIQHVGAATVQAPHVQQQKVDLDRVLQILEARGDADALVTLLEAKMQDPKARADLEGLGGINPVIKILDMENTTKNFATPAIGIFIADSVATQTENGGKWDEDKNRAWTVHQLGPKGSIDILLLAPVSGHAEDSYPDALYQQFTKSFKKAPADAHTRMRANAEIYSNNNSQYVYLTDDPRSYQMGKIVVADVKADGRYVTPVRVHLEGLEAGKTYEVRWSPYVGADPNNPVVHFAGFKNGRSFRLIIPSNVH
jgi:hypothetical protein